MALARQSIASARFLLATAPLPARLVGYALLSLPFLVWLFNGIYNPVLWRYGPAVFWTVDFVAMSAVPAAALAWMYLAWRVSPRDYGLPMPPRPDVRTAATALFLACSLYVATLVVYRFLWLVGLGNDPAFQWRDAMPGGAAGVFVLLYMSAQAGFFESIFFIGLPSMLSRRVPFLARHTGLVAFIASAVFALNHWEQAAAGVAGAFVFNVLAYACYRRLTTLWPIVVAHFLVDVLCFA